MRTHNTYAVYTQHVHTSPGKDKKFVFNYVSKVDRVISGFLPLGLRRLHYGAWTGLKARATCNGWTYDFRSKSDMSLWDIANVRLCLAELPPFKWQLSGLRVVLLT